MNIKTKTAGALRRPLSYRFVVGRSAQAEERQNGEHDDDQTDDVNDVVHGLAPRLERAIAARMNGCRSAFVNGAR
jgi:hypothetical protein